MLRLRLLLLLPAMAFAMQHWTKHGGKESNGVREQLRLLWQASISGLSFAEWLRGHVLPVPVPMQGHAVSVCM